MSYILDWKFWIAVIVISFVVHYVMKMLGGKGGSGQ